MQLTRSLSPGARRRATGWLAVAPLASVAALLAAPAPAQTLERIGSTGTLRVGHRIDARPFSYRDESGRAAGYSVVLCERIAAAVKEKLRRPDLRTRLVPLDAGERIDVVRQGKVDIFCGATTATLSRRENVGFSIAIFPSGIGALLRKDAPARMREVLSGRPEQYRPRWRASLGQILEKRTFSVRAGTTAESWLVEKLDEFEIIAEIEPVDDYEAGVEAIVARDADVLFGDRAVLLDAAERSPSASELMVLDRLFTYEPLALVLARGDEDFRLLVDRTLSGLYRSGEIEALFTTYFGEPGEEALSFFRMSALPE